MLDFSKICTFTVGGELGFVYMQNGYVFIQWRNFRNPLHEWDESIREPAISAIGHAWVNQTHRMRDIQLGLSEPDLQVITNRALAAEADLRELREEHSKLVTKMDNMIRNILIAVEHDCEEDW